MAATIKAESGVEGSEDGLSVRSTCREGLNDRSHRMSGTPRRGFGPELSASASEHDHRSTSIAGQGSRSPTGTRRSTAPLLAPRRRHSRQSLRSSGPRLVRGLRAFGPRRGELPGRGELRVRDISTVVGSDPAYTVEIERFRARVGGSKEMSPVAVRVTTVFRCEDGDWKVAHRHADPITEMRPAESVIGR
jgi:hypothetical protein